MIKIELFKCGSEESIVGAMEKIDKNSRGILYVVDNNDSLIGCLTDGDIRRWIIGGGSVNEQVNKVMNCSPIYVYEEYRQDGKQIMDDHFIQSIPIVDIRLHIIDILFSNYKNMRVFSDALKHFPVVVMAGGKGTRLYPYTKIMPKPLIPVGDVTILERIFDSFYNYGVNRFYLTVNYRKEMIKAYFYEVEHPYDIFYIEEKEALGTAGSLRLIEEEFDKPVIITNCDILIEADYADIIRHHVDSENDLTIVSSLKKTIIPYGVLKTGKDGIIANMEEKPQISNFINTGMYIIKPEFIEWIPEGKPYHMTQLIDKMINANKKVGMYPISENAFLDMGELTEMKRMEERLRS